MRTKSLSDLYKQWNRVFDYFAEKDWQEVKTHERIIDHASNSLMHYSKAFRKIFGATDYLNNQDFYTQVPVTQYKNIQL